MWEDAYAVAAALDDVDPLAPHRARFHLPRSSNGTASVYVCGHSLGLQPCSTAHYVNLELERWQDFGVQGHFLGERPWAKYEGLLQDQLALLAGAKPSEVVAMNSLTVNLHLLLVSFYRPTRRRFRILMEANAFPSDRFAVESQVQMHGLDPAAAIIEVSPPPGQHLIAVDDIKAALEAHGDSIALILLPGVQYYTGQVFDLNAIASLAHQHGCAIGADLAHSIGNVPLGLHDWNIDFAVWCSYKYLNSGPGGVGGCFVHERHGTLQPRLAGWWGQQFEKRFLMQMPLTPSEGAEGWQLSNPPILSLAALRASLDLFAEAGQEALQNKSERLQQFFDDLWDDTLHSPLVRLTPCQQTSRGAQVSLDTGTVGAAVHEALCKRGVICDWRPPAALRLSFAPLYASFSDVCRSVEALAACLQESEP